MLEAEKCVCAVRRQDEYTDGLFVCVMWFAYRGGELESNLGVSCHPSIPKGKGNLTFVIRV